jgi:hypothetical protein
MENAVLIFPVYTFLEFNVQLLKNFPAFYGTWRFITMFRRALHWSLS